MQSKFAHIGPLKCTADGEANQRLCALLQPIVAATAEVHEVAVASNAIAPVGGEMIAVARGRGGKVEWLDLIGNIDCSSASLMNAVFGVTNSPTVKALR